MKNLFKLDFRKLGVPGNQRAGSTVLSLALDGSRLDGVVLRRTNGSVQVQRSFSISLSLDPLTNDAELVGREVRNQLDAAGIREKCCVVALPLKWILTAHTAIPAIAEEDVASFLQIETERGFPCDVLTLMLVTSRSSWPSGERHATFIGIPLNHISALERVLRAAQLKPAGFSLGLTALQPAGSRSEGMLTLAIGETHVGLQLSGGGGIMALRALEGVLENQGSSRQLHADAVAREVRITLAQLPAHLRGSVKRVRIFGPADLSQQLADELELRLEAFDLQVETVRNYGPEELGLKVPLDAAVSPVISLGVRHLAREELPEFLPPKVSAWQQYASRYSSGRLQQAGLAAGIVGLVVAGAFAVQQAQLWRYEGQWAGMKKRVQELSATQAKIRQFLPWCDESIRALTVLRHLTEAFPEDGSVTARTLEIRDLSTVTCSGVARDYQALLKTVERLRALPQIPDVSLGQTRGQSPALQFTFSFVWSDGGYRAN